MSASKQTNDRRDKGMIILIKTRKIVISKKLNEY